MGHFAVALLALLAPSAVVASPIKARSSTAYQVKETHFVPRGWKKVERASADQVINLQIGLKQGNFEELERHLYEGKFGPLASAVRRHTGMCSALTANFSV